jgi:phosphoglucosamine mutase
VGKLFGTDGIRGVANEEPMTPETVVKLGRAAAYLFKTKAGRHSIVIGKDTRLHGYMLECALTSGICSMGVDVLLVGPLPTPGIAFITRSLRADAGIVISASHNPFKDNGIKFFSGEGLKLPDEMEERMEALITGREIERLRPLAAEIGKAYRINDAAGRYIEFAKGTVPKGVSFQGVKVVVDCAHGATTTDADPSTPTWLRKRCWNTGPTSASPTMATVIEPSSWTRQGQWWMGITSWPSAHWTSSVQASSVLIPWWRR